MPDNGAELARIEAELRAILQSLLCMRGRIESLLLDVQKLRLQVTVGEVQTANA
jgi:hypothetical protein